MLVAQILKAKGEAVFTIGTEESMAAAAALLHARKVGAMVVLGKDGEVAGILSERDLVRVIAELGAEALSRPVAGSMTREVIFAAPEETVDVLLARMTDRRVRHLPVRNAGSLAGIVSIGDLVKAKIAETQAEVEGLRAYIGAA
ncbi:MAG: CBS domain-containing protein [Caulobacteraceae bacterium]